MDKQFFSLPDMEYTNGAWIHKNAIIGKNVIICPGAVIGRIPISTNAQARKSPKELPPIEIGDNCVIGSNVVLYSGTKIGNNVLIGDTACIREKVVIGNDCIIAMGVTINYETIIGNRVKIMDNTHITGNMLIEDDVFIAMLVSFANDNSMGREAKLEVPVEKRVRQGAVIRKYATIGQGACILPNVEIGTNTIVGTGAIVTKSLPANVLAFGAPAKIIRELTEDEILKS